MLTGIPAAAQQDTMRMRVQGTSAAFSFKTDKAATYYVNWGDNQEQRQPYDANVEHELTHTYATDGTYDIIFYCEKKEKPIEIEMVLVEGGTFTMGCTSEQGNSCSANEKPAHKVTLSSYYISKYEITQAQWEAVMGTKLCYSEGDDLPVEMVSWDEAKEFCEKLSQKTSKNYALPTEAQWEFAARGGNKSQGYIFSGSNAIENVAWYEDNSDDQTHTVGTKDPNELGIYDMSGNVWEWCADWYGDYSSDAVTNPTGPVSGNFRVLRGGSGGIWSIGGIGDNYCRVSYRKGEKLYFHSYDIGFRVVCIP